VQSWEVKWAKASWSGGRRLNWWPPTWLGAGHKKLPLRAATGFWLDPQDQGTHSGHNFTWATQRLREAPGHFCFVSLYI
jgi:hypothetical protein